MWGTLFLIGGALVVGKFIYDTKFKTTYTHYHEKPDPYYDEPDDDDFCQSKEDCDK